MTARTTLCLVGALLCCSAEVALAQPAAAEPGQLRTKVYRDHVIDTIVKHVESEQDTVLVLGSRQLTKSERLHLGSVSGTLLKYVPCSVLIVRGHHA